MNSFYTILIGLLLRVGIPLAATVVVLILLNRLDKRWQKEAKMMPVAPRGKPCWEVKGCPQGKKQHCPAAAQPKVPCWQVFRTKDGVLKEACLGCEVFRQAPLPAEI